ncbi:MAG: hypothetical protein ACRD1D_11485 [Acidimicrobiales bacterium]
MFVQVIEGRVKDKDALRAQLDKWLRDLAPGATGWLGSTAGVTEDGTYIALVRFESEDAARANSDRPEQGEWWAETLQHLDGDATFSNCPQVDVFGGGGSDDAGFVQVIQGRGDRDKIVAGASKMEEILSRVRPDLIGGLMAWPGDGTFAQVAYFTSEAEARKGEQAEMSAEDAAAVQDDMAAMQMERFIDLRDPWLHSA